MSEIEEVEPRIPSPPIEEDILYVALGNDVKKSVTVLMWALHNSGGRKICILHIHQPDQKIPMDAMATKVPIRLLDEHKVREYHENQRQEMQEILEKYVQICRQEGNQAEALHREMDSIEKGIVQLLSQLRIKWLVMGTCKSYSRGKETTIKKIFSFRNSTREMIMPKSRKAAYVCLKAPSFCRISFIWKGNLIHTRDEIYGIFIDINPSSSEASPHAGTTESSLRSLSVTEGENDPLSLSGSFPNYRRVRSADLVRRRLSSEGSTDLDSPSRESAVDGICIERYSKSPQASKNAGTTEASLSSPSVTEGKNDGLNLPDPVPNCHTFGSDDILMRFLSLPDYSGTATPESRLNPEGSTYQDSASRRSPSVGSLFSTCPSIEIIQDTASGSLICTEENERLELPMPEDDEWASCRHFSVALNSLEGTMNDDIYRRLGQFAARVESFRRHAHEESVRRKKAESNVIDAILKAKASTTVYAELLRRRREIEESLESSKEEVEKMKSELVAVINAHRSQIANSNKTLEELEQKLFSAVELFHVL